MKKMKNITYLFLFLMLGVVSCELPDNVNPKVPSAVEASAIFTNAQVAMVNHIDNTSVNSNITRMFAQYWTETTYFTEARYNLADRNIPYGYWRILYRDVLQDLKEAKRLVTEREVSTEDQQLQKVNQLAVIDVMEVYTWQLLVDAFGDIPYTEALNGFENPHPVYDDAAGIYTALLAQISTAISTMNVSGASFGSADLLFSGDMASWQTFAASLKLRVAMRLADVNPGAAQPNVEAAVATGVYSTAGSGALLHYIGVAPHVGAIHNAFVVDGRKDFLPVSQIVEPMKAMNDPRLPMWFTKVDTSSVPGTSPAVYWGATYGLDGAQDYGNFSNFNLTFWEATFPAILIDYMEVEFLLAEAVERGWSVGAGTAEEHYNNAITESIDYYAELTGIDGDADAYLAQTDVAYTTATGTWRQVIGEQKWLGLYNRGPEAWAEWRRLDFPVLTPPEGMTYDDIPKRMPYPIKEDQLNKVNKDAAGSAIGGDNVSTKLFWDIN